MKDKYVHRELRSLKKKERNKTNGERETNRRTYLFIETAKLVSEFKLHDYIWTGYKIFRKSGYRIFYKRGY